MRWLLASLVLFVGSVCDVSAQEYSDEGTAYSACMASAQAAVAQFPSTRRGPECTHSGPGGAYMPNSYWACFEDRVSSSDPWRGARGCTSRHDYPGGRTCTTREGPPGGGASLFLASGAGTGVCFEGCYYEMGASGTTYKFGASSTSVMTSAGLAPNGVVCSVQDTPKQGEQCVPDGTLTQCVKPDGSHCATASTGKQFCWSPTEEGVKTAPNGNEAQTKSAEGKPINAPKTPPKNGGDWTVVNQSTTTINNGNSGTTYNNTTFNSNYGTQGNGSTGGGGSGEGGGDGGGDGDGDGDGEGDGHGAGVAIGELYEGEGLTLGEVLDDAYARATETKFGAAVERFMSVPGGGSCPAVNVPASQYWSAMHYSGHCEGNFLALLNAAGYLVLAVAAYLALRIAVT